MLPQQLGSLPLFPVMGSVRPDIPYLVCFDSTTLSGPMVWAPLSEVPQIGRMPIYILTIAVFIVLQVPTALSTNYDMLITFRFPTRLFGSPILATGGVTIADLYAPKKRAYGIALWGVFATCGPSLSPLLGGFAAHFKGWRWTIWELL